MDSSRAHQTLEALKPFAGTRVCISGGAGVIGSVLTLMLHRAGAHVWVGDLKPRPRNWPPEIGYRQGDLNTVTPQTLLDLDPHYFFHLAATFERSTETLEHWAENDAHNMQLGHHLMDILRAAPSLKRVVFAGSYLVYDPHLYQFEKAQSQARPLQENDAIQTRNLTGAAKLYHEAELEYLQQFDAYSWSAVTARIYRVYGCGSRDVISRWIQMLRNQQPIEVFRPEGLFDYIFADDVAEGLARLALCGRSGVVNLGSGQARQVADVVATLRNHFPGAQVHHGQSDIPYEASCADLQRLQAWTNWRPSTSLEAGISQIAAFQDRQQTISESSPSGNLLVTSASKKIALLEEARAALRKLGHPGALIAGDIDNQCLARHFADRFWHMPRLGESTLENLIAACRERDIRYLVPSRDGELPFFARHAAALNRAGIQVMISNLAAVELCIDKLAFANQLEKWGLPAIPCCEALADVPLGGIVVKERYGAGADRMGLNLSPKQARIHALTLENPIFQPYVAGREVSVDVYTDRSGKVKGAVVRRREMVVNGESQITATERHPAVENLACEIATRLKLYGHAVLQIMLDDRDQPHIVECNPRFGGASRLSVQAGLDSFYWFLLEAEGTPVDTYPFQRIRGERRLVRYPHDHIQEVSP